MNSLLRAGCEKVVVVTGKYDAEMMPVLIDRPEIIRAYNPKYAEGKATSVKTGIWALPDDVRSIVLLAVDQPRPTWGTERILNEHADYGADITSPRFNDHGGHPLIFNSSLISLIKAKLVSCPKPRSRFFLIAIFIS